MAFSVLSYAEDKEVFLFFLLVCFVITYDCIYSHPTTIENLASIQTSNGDFSVLGCRRQKK